MREIIIDARNWATSDDLYDAFLSAVGAPSWHGHNFNALRDSICGGQINKIEVPYLVKIKNFSSIGQGARSAAQNFVQLIKELHNSGCPVDIEVQD